MLFNVGPEYTIFFRLSAENKFRPPKPENSVELAVICVTLCKFVVPGSGALDMHAPVAEPDQPAAPPPEEEAAKKRLRAHRRKTNR